MTQAPHPFPDAPEIATERVPCGLCGESDAEPFAQSRDYEYQTCRNHWQFVRCKRCGNVYLNPRPSSSELGRIYSGDYYSYSYDDNVNAVARRAKSLIDAARFRRIRRAIDVPMQAYLDIGCGDGRYLHAMARTGLAAERIYGVEIDPHAAERLGGSGFHIVQAPFEEAHDLPSDHFTLITLFSVLEHMASPRATLARVHELLHQGGLLVFEIPNIDSLNAEWFHDEYWGGYHTPRHWNFPPLQTIRTVAEPIGLHLVDVIPTTGHAFWLWSLHHAVRFKWGWDRVGRWLNPGRCLPGVALATAIDMLRARFGGRTDNQIILLKKL